MSNLKVNTINDASGGSAAVLYGVASPPNSMGFRNRLINSDMRIDQRNAGASVTASSTGAVVYTLDRWAYVVSQASKFTIQQNAGSVTPPAGFKNYLGVTSSSAYSVLSTDDFRVIQHVEGFNVADLAWGTASAATVTLSFWVRSSLTGTFGGSAVNGAADRSYPFTYTISAANTWEQKSVTIAGDTSGTWLSTNGIGLRLIFGLGTGSTYSGTAGAWASTFYASATGATSVVGTNGATFYITGVQLEAGSVASPFERRDYGRELIMCQRYFYMHAPKGSSYMHNNIFYYSNTEIDGAIQFPVAMRASPSLVTASGTNYYICERNNGSDYFDAWGSITYASTTACGVSCPTNISGTAGQAGWARNSDTVNAYLAFNSEL